MDGPVLPLYSLAAGDAEVLIWEKLWEKHKKKPEVLAYDMLLSPHHCSWHSLSYDSRSEKGDKAKGDAELTFLDFTLLYHILDKYLWKPGDLAYPGPRILGLEIGASPRRAVAPGALER